MKSIWNQTTDIFPSEPLTRDITVDTAVIGGGMAGILTAYLLKEHGTDVVVLEANTIGSGQTENTTAKITSQHGLIYDRLLQEWGERGAHQYAMANQEAIESYAGLIKKLKINCDFKRQPAYLYTLSDPEILEREKKAALNLGIKAETTTCTGLPFPVENALCFPEQAMFHPLKFLKALASQVTVYGETRAERVEEHTIYTGRHKVEAEHIVFATHFPFVNFPGLYFLRMHQERSYVLALRQAGQLNGMYLGIDKEANWSFRNSGDLLLLGGGGHRTGENRDGGKYRELERKAREFWPVSREVARWSAQDCMPLDGIPYIGQFAKSRPNWYVATGFGKWGMTSSMVAAQILTDKIRGQFNPYEEIFSPGRAFKKRALASLMKEGAHAVTGLSRGLFAPRKIEGKAPEHNPRCPHLGCRLEWNPDEEKWECPCHGSRFGETGKLENNPAEEDLPYKALP